jgi:hypothetical protein
LKSGNNHSLSIRGEQIKRIIRNAYKNKIDNYHHDIIIHIGDNYYQNYFIKKLFSLNVDINIIFEVLAPYNYAISKLDVPYMPNDFPIHFPLNKDIDILCSELDYNAIISCVFAFLNKYQEKLSIKTTKKYINRKEYRTLIRFELGNYLIYQFDISSYLEKTRNGFQEMVL